MDKMAQPSTSTSTSTSSIKPVPAPTTDFPSYLSRVTSSLDVVTTHAAALPDRSDLAFHRTLDRGLAKDLDKLTSKILSMTESLLGLVENKSLVSRKGKQRQPLQDEEDIVNGYRRGVVGVVDGLLEDADSSLDEIHAQKKRAKLAKSGSAAEPSEPLMGNEIGLSAAAYPRPQSQFLDAVDNSNSRTTWEPTLRVKHHAMIPLGQEVPLLHTFDTTIPDHELQTKLEAERARHPYYHEIRHLSYPTAMFTDTPPILPRPIEDVSPVWVDTPEALNTMVEELKVAKEIAVDLEHHDHYSYYGFTCLMQISTRDKDWLIDTLKVRGELRKDKLGGVFADPSIVKVFHGASSDVRWLQKDFDLYLVNLFDTFCATLILDMPEHSLAYLLDTFCGFKKRKTHSTGDWRVRPLSPAMMLYAQADTHFLLYVYDRLKNSLLQKSRSSSPVQGENDATPGPRTNPQRAMREVLALSADVALNLYKRQRGQPVQTSMKKLLGKTQEWWDTDYKGFIFKALYEWRDCIARKEDIAPEMVLSSRLLQALCHRQPVTPRIARKVLIDPSNPDVGDRAEEIADIITKARADCVTYQEALQIHIAASKSPSPAPAPDGSTTEKPVDTDISEAEEDGKGVMDPISPSTGPEMDAASVQSVPVRATSWDAPAQSESREGRIKIVRTKPTVLEDEHLWDFWGGVGNNLTRVQASSSLFGQALPAVSPAVIEPSPGASVAIKTSSTLFGSSIALSASTHRKVQDNQVVDFESVRSWVSSSFDDRPMPQPVDAQDNKPPALQISASASRDIARTDLRNAVFEAERVPFIPAASRSTIHDPTSVHKDGVPTVDTPEIAPISAAGDVVQVGRKKGKSMRKRILVAERKANKEAKQAHMSDEEKAESGEARPKRRAARKEKKENASSKADSDDDEDSDVDLSSIAPAAPVTPDESGKKRKRQSKSKSKLLPEVPEFSYESVPNLLDNPSSATPKKKKSKKEKKEKTVLSGTTFGSVPKDNSQPKAGNKSKTFA